MIWGDQVVWGDQIYTNQAAWSQGIVWGDRMVWGDRIVWGDSTVLSEANRLVWGDRIVWGDTMIGYNTGNGSSGAMPQALRPPKERHRLGRCGRFELLSSLSADDDPFGFEALDEDTPARRHHLKKTKERKSSRKIERGKKRSERKMVAGGDR